MTRSPASTAHRAQRVLVLHGLLFVAALLVTAAALQVSNPEPLIRPFCVGVLALFVWSLCSWRAATGRLFDPYGLLLVAAFCFNAGHALLEVIRANPLGLMDGRFSSETTLATLAFVFVGFCALHFGALIAVVRRSGARIPRAHLEPSPADLSVVGWGMFGVAVIPAFIVLYRALNLTLHSGYFALYRDDAPVGFNATPRVLASFLVPAALFMLAGSRGSRTQRMLSASILALFATTMLIIGSRAPAVMSLLAYAWLWHRCVRRVSGSTLLIGASASLFLLLPLVRVVRSDFGADRFLFPYLREAFFTIENPSLASVAEMGGTMTTIAHTLECVPELRDYDLGLSYAYALLTVVPNAFWDIHPTIAHGLAGTWLTNLTEPVLARMGGGIGYSFMAEVYLNFGWFGLAALILIGFLFARLVLWATESDSLARMAGLASFTSSFLFFVRSESGAVLRPLFWYALVPYLACHGAARLRQRLHGPRPHTVLLPTARPPEPT